MTLRPDSEGVCPRGGGAGGDRLGEDLHLCRSGRRAALEINNLCNGIINYAQLLTDDLADKVPEEQNLLLARIISEGERIVTLVDPLLGRQPEGPEPAAILGK